MSFFPNKILLATDGSRDAARARNVAVDLQRETGSELHVVHVGLVAKWAVPDTLSKGQFERLRQQAQGVLDQEVEKIREAGGTIADAHRKMGRPDVEVVRLSQQIGAGLLVIGNRGQGALARILLGNDAESIVRHAPCPVMVVRADETG